MADFGVEELGFHRKNMPDCEDAMALRRKIDHRLLVRDHADPMRDDPPDSGMRTPSECRRLAERAHAADVCEVIVLLTAAIEMKHPAMLPARPSGCAQVTGPGVGERPEEGHTAVAHLPLDGLRQLH